MFMRFLGGGIGHKVTDFVQQRSSESICATTELDVQDEEIVVENIEYEPQDEGEVREEDDVLEDVDLDEELDFGYADEDEGSAAEESEQDANSEDDEDSCGL
jgi:hypothetical protein